MALWRNALDHLYQLLESISYPFNDNRPVKMLLLAIASYSVSCTKLRSNGVG